MAVVLPYHQDQRLGADSIAVPRELTTALLEPRLPDADRWLRLVRLYDAMADQVASQARTGAVTAAVSGDCLALLGALAGAQRAGMDPAIVWFDAHGDVHTLASSTSGYLGGMALRMALGGDPDRLIGPLGLRPVSEERAVLVDARDLDPAEITYLAASAIRRRTVDDISARDLPAGPVLLHIDLDVIDPAELPGLRFPAAGGPSKTAVLAAVERLIAGGRVAALHVACPWHDPTDDVQQRTRRTLLTQFLEMAESA